MLPHPKRDWWLWLSWVVQWRKSWGFESWLLLSTFSKCPRARHWLDKLLPPKITEKLHLVTLGHWDLSPSKQRSGFEELSDPSQSLKISRLWVPKDLIKTHTVPTYSVSCCFSKTSIITLKFYPIQSRWCIIVFMLYCISLPLASLIYLPH